MTEPDGADAPLFHEVVVNLTPRTYDALERAAELGMCSRTDAVNKAIQLYEVLMQVEADGGTITLQASRDAVLTERLRVF